MKYEVISEKFYAEPIEGISLFSDNLVHIIGEQKARFESGEEREFYLYSIDGHTSENGKPFVSLKANIVLI